MSRAYSELMFTPTVRAQQTRMGSRSNYARLDQAPDRRDRLGEAEASFIEGRDGFYQATVSETGWPYVQFRGGPVGFVKVLDERTIAYADFRGNVQYISVGNLLHEDRISIILMDPANQRRLKLIGRVRLVDAASDPGLIAQLRVPGYDATIERAVLITIEGFDWNCPQHITPRFTEEEIAAAAAPLRQQLQRAQKELAELRQGAPATSASPASATSPASPLHSLGKGPLALTVTGLRQLTPAIRAYELRSADGQPLPAVAAGAHIDMPVRTATGEATRRYSITAADTQHYEIAVLREAQGSGGSAAVHADYALGLTLYCPAPGNDFALHSDARPALLLAGGIGITPLRAMAYQLAAQGRAFELHYAVRSQRDGAYADELQARLGARVKVYAANTGQRLHIGALLAASAPDTQLYVCGPTRLMEAVRHEAQAQGLPDSAVHAEAFSAPALGQGSRPLTVTLQRSAKVIAVAADRSVLDAVQAAGIDTPASCRTGSCGSCAVKVLAGQPMHRDQVLSETERNSMMCICVSRAQGDALTLDL